jgi:hypothetical protein
MSLLKAFGFEELTILNPDGEDYEQFRRAPRVMVYGRKGLSAAT